MKIVRIGDSLNEYEGEFALVFWMCGCNIHCNYCYNYKTVMNLANSKFNEMDVIKAITDGADLYSALVATGGEPTCQQDDLYKLFEVVRCKMPHSIKLKIHSNGTNLNFLSEMINDDLLDSLTFDIKLGDLVDWKLFDGDKVTYNIIEFTKRFHNIINIEWRSTLPIDYSGPDTRNIKMQSNKIGVDWIRQTLLTEEDLKKIGELDG